QTRSAEGAKEDRVVHHPGLTLALASPLVLELDHADRHVKNSVLADGDQRFELLAAHRLLKLVTARTEAPARRADICRHVLTSPACDGPLLALVETMPPRR